MSDDRVDLCITVPTRADALALASSLVGYAVTEFARPDGWLDGIYWCLHEIGERRGPATFDGEGNLVAEGEPVPGWHLIGRWHGPWASVPPALAALHVERGPDWPRFG